MAPAWAYLLPFALLAILHYARFSTYRPNQAALRRGTLTTIRSQQRVGAVGAAAGPRTVVAPVRAAGAHALSSEEATQIALDKGTARVRAAAAAVASPVHGVVTAAELHAALGSDAVVWLTFSNAAYLHFAQVCGAHMLGLETSLPESNYGRLVRLLLSSVHRTAALVVLSMSASVSFNVELRLGSTRFLCVPQNFYLSTAAVGRAPQLAVAALDASSLESWASLGVPVLNFSSFGDASDFRGIGSDQARIPILSFK